MSDMEIEIAKIAVRIPYSGTCNPGHAGEVYLYNNAYLTNAYLASRLSISDGRHTSDPPYDFPLSPAKATALAALPEFRRAMALRSTRLWIVEH
jgi:hypothetical protein